TCLSPFDGGEDIVYELTVLSEVTVDIMLDPLGTAWTGILLDDACPPDFSCIDYSASSGSAPHGMTSLVLAAGTYYIMVDTWPAPDCIPTFDLHITEGLPPCQVECPGGSTDEGEPCGDDTNGGCNSPVPIFRDITCGETVCGTGWFDGGLRDTDWYRLVLDGFYEVTWTVQAEFEALIGPLEVLVPGNIDCGNMTGFINPAGFTLKCEEGSVTVTLGPGEHLFFVAPLFADIVACPGDYWASLTCVPTGADYCAAASAGCGPFDEWISSVAVGDIFNESGCSFYSDYTGLSTAMTVGGTYPIMVTIDQPYDEDAGATYIDWNQDYDFDDADERIDMAGSPGPGPYTADIMVPAHALPGPTRLRIRLTWNQDPGPCGTHPYGEVEDYTVVVEEASTAFQIAIDPDPIFAAMARTIEPRCVDIYIGGEIAPGYGPGDVNQSSLLINGVPAVQAEV
ncbi:MAG: GEVED domain-containing protein, partial [Candidatus Zixiibacteriota bacterium]